MFAAAPEFEEPPASSSTFPSTLPPCCLCWEELPFLIYPLSASEIQSGSVPRVLHKHSCGDVGEGKAEAGARRVANSGWVHVWQRWGTRIRGAVGKGREAGPAGTACARPSPWSCPGPRALTGSFNIFVVFGESRLRCAVSSSGWHGPCIAALFSAEHLLRFKLIFIFFHKSHSALGFPKELKRVSLFSSKASLSALTNSYWGFGSAGDNAGALLFLCRSLFSSPSSQRSNASQPLSHSPCYLRSRLSRISARV